MRAEDDGHDRPDCEIGQDEDGDDPGGGVREKPHLGRKAGDMGLEPLRTWEGEGGHRQARNEAALPSVDVLGKRDVENRGLIMPTAPQPRRVHFELHSSAGVNHLIARTTSPGKAF